MSPIHPNISFVRNHIRLVRHRPRCPTIMISHLLTYGLLPSVIGSKQIGTRFEVIPEPLDQEIRTGQPDLFKHQSGFKHQTGSTRYPGVQVDLTWSYFRYIKGLDQLDRRTGPGCGRVLVDCNMKMIHELDLVQSFVTIAFSNAKGCRTECHSVWEESTVPKMPFQFILDV